MIGIDSLRGALAFPEAGEDVYLRFRAADKMDLQVAFGADWFSSAHDRLNAFDIPYITACVRVGVKKDGKPHKIDLDALEDAGLFMTTVCEKILDGLYVSNFGIPFLEHVKKRFAEAEAAKAEEDAKALAAIEKADASPTLSPASSSEN